MSLCAWREVRNVASQKVRLTLGIWSLWPLRHRRGESPCETRDAVHVPVLVLWTDSSQSGSCGANKGLWMCFVGMSAQQRIDAGGAAD